MFRRPRNLVLGITALLAIALLVPFINLGRYRRRVSFPLGGSLGRRVEVGGVHLELLPWPALVAENVTVGEVPSMGLEPIARMTELRATLRMRSLWTGRPDLSSVVFVEPSVNLARGHFAGPAEALRVGPGISGAPVTEAREFPYVEVRDGRINFKRDDVKSVFFFSEVQAAV